MVTVILVAKIAIIVPKIAGEVQRVFAGMVIVTQFVKIQPIVQKIADLLVLTSAPIQAKKKEDVIVQDIYKKELVETTIQILVWNGLLGKQFKIVEFLLGHQNIDVQET
ncbi:MAG: hypothetical protein QXG39_07705 [Candidatus Aenigmatarchaeota archaeon]